MKRQAVNMKKSYTMSDMSDLAARVHAAKVKKDLAEDEFSALRQEMIDANPRMEDVAFVSMDNVDMILTLTSQEKVELVEECDRLRELLGVDYHVHIKEKPSLKSKEVFKSLCEQRGWSGLFKITYSPTLRFK